jgi:hypothetical protein
MNAFRLVVALISGLVGAILVLPLVLFVSPWVFVLMVMRSLARWIEPSHLPWQQLVEFDPCVGWRTKPGLKGYHLADDDVYQTTTDAEGWRGRTTLDESQVLVFGDSYVFGHAAGDRHFFADLNPQLRVKAIGVDGYNMVQEFMWMRRLAPRMRGKLAIWFIYLGNDLTDSLATNIEGYRIPFVRENRETGRWEIVTSHLSASPWPSGPGYHHATFYERVAKIFVPGPFSTRVFSACEYLISEADRVTRQAGSRLIVVSIPSKNMLLKKEMQMLKRRLSDDSKFDVGYPDWQLGRICHRLDVHFVAGKDHLGAGHYRECESHWNEKGSRRVSELLASLYSECRFRESVVPENVIPGCELEKPRGINISVALKLHKS